MKPKLEDWTRRRRLDWPRLLELMLMGCVVFMLLSFFIWPNKPAPQSNSPAHPERVLDLDQWDIAQAGRFYCTVYDSLDTTLEGGKYDRLGRPLRGRAVCAVDGNVIAFGSLVWIEDFGLYYADDCSEPPHRGGKIHGKRIDINVPGSYGKGFAGWRNVVVLRSRQVDSTTN